MPDFGLNDPRDCWFQLSAGLSSAGLRAARSSHRTVRPAVTHAPVWKSRVGPIGRLNRRTRLKDDGQLTTHLREWNNRKTHRAETTSPGGGQEWLSRRGS